MSGKFTILAILMSFCVATACSATESEEKGTPTTTISYQLNRNEPDSAYREALKDAEVSLPYDEVRLAEIGRTSCDILERSGSNVLMESYRRTYGLTVAQRSALVDAAINSYCPELAGS